MVKVLTQFSQEYYDLRTSRCYTHIALHQDSNKQQIYGLLNETILYTQLSVIHLVIKGSSQGHHHSKYRNSMLKAQPTTAV